VVHYNIYNWVLKPPVMHVELSDKGMINSSMIATTIS